MTPSQLAKANNEHSHQRALFAWLNMASRYGFEAAWNDLCYTTPKYAEQQYGTHRAVAVLQRAYAVPNGGQRDKITAGKLKAEGVKRGVPDVTLPLPMRLAPEAGQWAFRYCGLYVEMKRPKANEQRQGVTSPEQDDWIAYLRSVGYAVAVCFDWEAAAKQIQSYVEDCPQAA
jgi:hypothetical protein